MYTLEKYLPEIENKELLWISYDNKIPSNYNGISVSFSFDDKGNIEFETISHKKTDPSTIWIHLPIGQSNYVESLPYFPHYIDLSPAQRYKYLTWLRNVDEEIDVGFVFLYFYGLERHLLIGDIEKAINQIIRLRNKHSNKSFQNYTRNSIIHACIMRNRIDLLYCLNNLTNIPEMTNAQLLLAYNLGYSLSSDNLLSIFYKMFPKVRKAYKENYKLLNSAVSDVLCEIYGNKSFTIKNIDISNSPISKEVRFCNYTFPDEIRFVEITDFYKNTDFTSKMSNIFNLSYEKYKATSKHKLHEN